MHKEFHTLDELFVWIKTDKEWDGADAGLHNRYPIRFILFDNFADFHEFIVNRPSGIYKHSIETMLDNDYPDLFLSYSQLSKLICDYVKKIPINDFVIYPFSEMTRFYQNDKGIKEFDSLVKTIRLQQPSEAAQLEHVRLYIPIVGMEGKMTQFIADSNTFVWEYKTNRPTELHRLILTNGELYGVNGLEEDYNVIHNLKEWLKLWEQGEDVKKNIICSSKTIFLSADHAQPDNAFEYVICNNAYEFLTKGLKLGFENIPLTQEDLTYWEEFASNIDVFDFDLDIFINERFDSYNISSNKNFIEAWLDCETDFDKWLLSVYYRKASGNNGYICRALSCCSQLTKSELFSNIATNIFEESYTQQDVIDRKEALDIALDHNVKITDEAENRLFENLISFAENPSIGYYQASKLLTSFTLTERKLIVEWLGKDKISRSDIETIYPDLYHYMHPLFIQQCAENSWVNRYFDKYRKSKISNSIQSDSLAMLLKQNANSADFQLWRDNFKTVKTLLHNREDIEVFYWVDGLGVDWIPFILNVIRGYEHEGAYVNEVLIASAELPTITSVNKLKLDSLVPSGELEKCGDLDELAHKHSQFPDYVIDEMNVVRKAIVSVLDQFNNKKIAFISDHGISYLAQYGRGLNLSGIAGEHEGRLAKKTSNSVNNDTKYVVLEDQQTLCALTYDSLAAKTNKGHGAHGGCTPEEVLVPIIIVSPNKNPSCYTAKIDNNNVASSDPVVRFTILGLSSIDFPELTYNGRRYMMKNLYGNLYESEKLNLNDTATTVILHINDFEQKETIKILLGVKEDDLFGDL